MEAIKACPFCGSNANLIDATEACNQGAVVVECTGCHASGPVVFSAMDDPKPHAVYMWNRRVDDTEYLRNKMATLALMILGQHLWADRIFGSANIACLCRRCEEARHAFQLATSAWPTTEQEHLAMQTWGRNRGGE